MTTRQAIILRGIAGSGKSTLATALTDDARCRGVSARIVSADACRYVDGAYVFGHLTAHCHDAALREWIVACDAGVETLICDATNPTMLRWWPYAAIAHAYGYRVHLATIDCSTKMAARLKHGLTSAELERQLQDKGLGDDEIEGMESSVPWLRKHRMDANMDLDEAVALLQG